MLIAGLGWWFAGGVEAQVCQDDFGSIPGVPSYSGLATSIPTARNCVGWYSCNKAVPGGVSYSLAPLGCNPASGTCTAAVDVTAKFPGNNQSFVWPTPPPGWQPPSDSLVKLLWTNGSGQFTGSCGNSLGKILDDEGIAKLALPMSCAAYRANPAAFRFVLTLKHGRSHPAGLVLHLDRRRSHPDRAPGRPGA